ncbi:phosphatidylglycerophosphatase A [Vibrio metschnikovii CIP 69.14]|nr:phosphatidylglycerophosphatase A [Vibrio metschnikovii CIP 69.14]
MQVHDHGSIVWDEFAGFWITMSIVPLLQLPIFDWQWIVTGFVLFRFFDMVKPWPIGWLDKQVEGGVGIMLDDIVAGIMAAIMLFFVGQWAGWLN